MINRQDFINAINKNIDMVKGDTLAFNFQIHGLGSRADYEALEVAFVVAENYNGDAIIEVTQDDNISLADYNVAKDVATFAVWVAPTMTESLDLDRYYYDLQIKTDDDVLTLMRGRLTLLYDIAD